jgi:hypothetical protein
MQTCGGTSSGAVDERNHDIQARPEDGVIFAQALDHPGMLLRHDLDGFNHEDDGEDEKYQGQRAKSDFHDVLTPVDW